MCTPVPHPEHPEDYPVCLLKMLINQDMLVKEGLGFSWFRSSRLSPVYHSSHLGLLKLTVFNYYNKKALKDKLEMLCQINKE